MRVNKTFFFRLCEFCKQSEALFGQVQIEQNNGAIFYSFSVFAVPKHMQTNEQCDTCLHKYIYFYKAVKLI
jgi:hypothetical protein